MHKDSSESRREDEPCFCLYELLTLSVSSLILPDENEAEMAEKAPDDEDDDSISSGGDDDDDEEGTITEIRFVPSDKAACE